MKKLPPESFVQDLINVCKTLEEIKTPYMLIGGLAVSLWSTPRATVDLDFAILLEPDHFNHFKNKFEKTNLEHAALQIFSLKKAQFIRFLLTHQKKDFVIVDLMLANNDFLKTALKRKRSFILEKQKIYVARPEDLILLKLMSFRPQDITDISNLLYLKDLELKYIKEWAKKLNVQQRLKKFS